MSAPKFTDLDRQRMASSFEKHRAEMHITADRYVRLRKIEMGDHVMQRERVYLDLNYWIRLRNAAMGRSSDHKSALMLGAIRKSVREKSRICPISETTFLELLKQEDEETRLATANLIDELSEGVSLSPIDERMATEVAHFMHASLGHDVLPLNRLVWSKLGYILGVMHPVTAGIEEGEQLVIQKAFFDHMWDIPLADMVPMLGADTTQKGEYSALAERLNDLNRVHVGEVTSFKKVYEDEFIGGLELSAKTGQQVMESMWIDSSTEPRTLSEVERRDATREVFALLRSIFKHKQDVITKALPTLHIGALCHAAVRWDQKRRLVGNDLFDFHHAQAALPYCNVFLTEKPLHVLLQQKHVNIGKHFPCRIISAQDEAAEYLCSADH